jgi:hypothetical protein
LRLPASIRANRRAPAAGRRSGRPASISSSRYCGSCVLPSAGRSGVAADRTDAS